MGNWSGLKPTGGGGSGIELWLPSHVYDSFSTRGTPALVWDAITEKTYLSVMDHTSGTTFAADLAAHKWRVAEGSEFNAKVLPAGVAVITTAQHADDDLLVIKQGTGTTSVVFENTNFTAFGHWLIHNDSNVIVPIQDLNWSNGFPSGGLLLEPGNAAIVSVTPIDQDNFQYIYGTLVSKQYPIISSDWDMAAMTTTVVPRFEPTTTQGLTVTVNQSEEPDVDILTVTSGGASYFGGVFFAHGAEATTSIGLPTDTRWSWLESPDWVGGAEANLYAIYYLFADDTATRAQILDTIFGQPGATVPLAGFIYAVSTRQLQYATLVNGQQSQGTLPRPDITIGDNIALGINWATSQAKYHNYTQGISDDFGAVTVTLPTDKTYKPHIFIFTQSADYVASDSLKFKISNGTFDVLRPGYIIQGDAELPPNSDGKAFKVTSNGVRLGATGKTGDIAVIQNDYTAPIFIPTTRGLTLPEITDLGYQTAEQVGSIVDASLATAVMKGDTAAEKLIWDVMNGQFECYGVYNDAPTVSNFYGARFVIVGQNQVPSGEFASASSGSIAVKRTATSAWEFAHPGNYPDFAFWTCPVVDSESPSGSDKNYFRAMYVPPFNFSNLRTLDDSYHMTVRENSVSANLRSESFYAVGWNLLPPEGITGVTRTVTENVPDTSSTVYVEVAVGAIENLFINVTNDNNDVPVVVNFSPMMRTNEFSGRLLTTGSNQGGLIYVKRSSSTKGISVGFYASLYGLIAPVDAQLYKDNVSTEIVFRWQLVWSGTSSQIIVEQIGNDGRDYYTYIPSNSYNVYIRSWYERVLIDRGAQDPQYSINLQFELASSGSRRMEVHFRKSFYTPWNGTFNNVAFENGFIPTFMPAGSVMVLTPIRLASSGWSTYVTFSGLNTGYSVGENYVSTFIDLPNNLQPELNFGSNAYERIKLNAYINGWVVTGYNSDNVTFVKTLTLVNGGGASIGAWPTGTDWGDQIAPTLGSNLNDELVVEFRRTGGSSKIYARKLYSSADNRYKWKNVASNQVVPPVGGRYNVDTSSSAISLTLPTVPDQDFELIVKDAKGTFATNNCTLVRNGTGYTIANNASDLVLNINYPQILLGYDSTNTNITY